MWEITKGDVLKRAEIHKRYGGSSRSGIAPCAGDSKNVLLFSTPKGKIFGYNFDGWRNDGSYHYTGEGQGDQTLTRGNKALRYHVKQGRRLRLFTSDREGPVRYDGEFRIDEKNAYYVDESPNKQHKVRMVLVFRLRPVDTISPDPSEIRATTSKRVVNTVAVESHLTATYPTNPPQMVTIAERREGALIQRFIDWFKPSGQKLARNEILLPNSAQPHYTDLFNLDTGELVEAKGSSSRNHVRLAIGQLFDYGRHVDHQSLVILLPSYPGDDLAALLKSLKITLIHESTPGKFVRIEP